MFEHISMECTKSVMFGYHWGNRDKKSITSLSLYNLQKKPPESKTNIKLESEIMILTKKNSQSRLSNHLSNFFTVVDLYK